MARSPRHISPLWPSHITARCANRDWFRIPLDKVWALAEIYLHFLHSAFEIEIFSFVLMPNHFHLIARAPRQNLPEAMQYFMREFSRAISSISGHINQTFGARYHQSLIGSDRHFVIVYKYVYRNPVTARICDRAVDYPYSTLSGLLGQRPMLIPLKEDQILFENVEACLSWIDQEPTEDSLEAVRKAVRRRVFRLPRTKSQKLSPVLSSQF